MTGEPASPVCYAGQGCDLYMGYAPVAELIERLNQLIEAERAGNRVAKSFHRAAGAGPARAFLKRLQSDEAGWCAMLCDHVQRLGGTPSPETGAFFAKALAVEGDAQRLAFLNRGQAWVVRALDDLTPRVRDEQLHGDLKRMRDAHVVNIASVELLLAAQDQPPPSA